jgi:putative transposase
MLVSLIYRALRRVLARLRCRSREFRNSGSSFSATSDPSASAWTPKLNAADRVFLAAASRLRARERWGSLFVTPRHAAALASPAGREALDVCDAQPRPPCGRRRAQRAGAPARAREPAPGLSADRGASSWALGSAFSQTIVRKLVGEAGIGPAGARGGPSRREFLRRQAQSSIACGFFTVETVTFATDLRALLQRARISARAPGRRGQEPSCPGHPAGAPRGVVATAASEHGPLPDPRPRRQVHGRLRRGLRERER